MAVVTGGSRGIGRAFVCEAASRGYDVVFTHRGSGLPAAQLSGETMAGRDVVGVHADVVNPDDIRSVAKVAEGLGPVRILINNAGMMAHGTLAEQSDEGWNTSMAVHVTAPLLFTRALLESLKANGGCVLNVSSTGGVVGSLHGAAYGASKAAVLGLTKSMARELAPHVRVNAIAPGPIATDLYASLPEDERTAVEAETPLRRVGAPEEMALVGLDLCHWGYATGITVIADGGRVMQ